MIMIMMMMMMMIIIIITDQRILTQGCIRWGGFFTGTMQCDTDQSAALQFAAAVAL